MVIAQVGNYAIPLLLIPYLVRVLGVAGFGEFAVVQAIINVGIIVVQLGLNIYITKHIAEIIKNRESINGLVSLAYLLQISIAIILVAISWGIYKIFPENVMEMLFLYSFSWLGQAIFPVWYFQGTQRFKQLAFLNLMLRLSAFVLILIYVNQINHILRIPVIYSSSYIATGLIASVYMWRRHKFSWQGFRKIIDLVRNVRSIFLSNMVSILLMNMPIFFLNKIVTKEEVGVFSAILRIVYAIKGLLSTSFQVMIPAFISNKNNINIRDITQKVLLLVLLIVFASLMLREIVKELLYGSVDVVNYDIEYIVLMLSVIPGVMGTLYVFVFSTYFGAFRIRMHVFIRVFVMAILLYYPFIVSFKSIGAAYVILISETMLFFLGSKAISHKF